MHISGDMPAHIRNRLDLAPIVMFCAIAAAAMLPPIASAQDSRNDAAEITTTIEGRIYTWRVKNVGNKPIMRFEIPVYKVYDHHVPEGWIVDASLTRYGAAAESERHAIAPGETKVFTCRAASMTSVATAATAIIGFGDDEQIEMPGLWAPMREKWHTLLIPPLVISLLAIAYALRTRAKSRCAAQAST